MCFWGIFPTFLIYLVYQRIHKCSACLLKMKENDGSLMKVQKCCGGGHQDVQYYIKGLGANIGLSLEEVAVVLLV
jgi:hypothetical protein